MRVQVLGPLLVDAGTGPVPVTSPKQRLLLSLLASRVGSVVQRDLVIDTMWAAEPPASIRKSLSWHVTQIREILGDPGSVVARDGGYTLNIDSDNVDCHRFESLYRQGRTATDPREASRALHDALSLWRGAAFDGLDHGPLRHEAERLNEARLLALEARCRNEMALGRHETLIAELTALVEHHPLRENFRGLLIRSLRGCGRLQEALRLFETGRELLADRLGLEPSRELRGLAEEIQRDSPDSASHTPQAAVTRQLPAPTTSFCGRETQVRQLCEAARSDSAPGAATVAVISGMAGVGKTTLAVHAAHHLAPEYSDGQLFVDLRGFSAQLAPVSAAEALEQLLRALGVSDDTVPGHLDDRAALYRTILNSRKMIVVLDNARDESQVRHLFPGDSASLVIVTSRNSLWGLDSVHRMGVPEMSSGSATRLFTSACTDSSVADPAVVADIVELCGGLPLAIRMAASRFAIGDIPLSRLRDRLRDHTALHELTTDEGGVAAAFEVSFRTLSPPHQRLLSSLGQFPGAEFDVYTAAVLDDETVADTETRLDRLAELNLILPAPAGRFRMHDLLRAYTFRLSDETTARLARSRVVTVYGQIASEAISRIDPHAVPPTWSGPTHPGIPELPDEASARSWHEVEYQNISAVINTAIADGALAAACQLASLTAALAGLLSQYDRVLSLSHKVLAAAQQLDDRHTQARALSMTAIAWCELGRPSDAIAPLNRSLALRDEDDVLGVVSTLNNLGLVHARMGQFDRAVEIYKRALANEASVEDIAAMVPLLYTNWAQCRVRAGRPREALPLLRKAATAADALDNARQTARLRFHYGDAHAALEDYDRAAMRYEQAREYFATAGEPFGHATAVNGLANVQRAQGDLSAALRGHETALRVCREARDKTLEAELLHDFGVTLSKAGRTSQARDTLRAATALARQVQDAYTLDRSTRALASLLGSSART